MVEGGYANSVASLCGAARAVAKSPPFERRKRRVLASRYSRSQLARVPVHAHRAAAAALECRPL